MSKKINYFQVALVILTVLFNSFLLYSLNNLNEVFRNLFYSVFVYIIMFSLTIVILKYLKEPYYKISLILNFLVSILFFILNINNYVPLFMSTFYLFLIIFRAEKCIDKFTSKISLSRTLALFISIILFWFFMNPVYYSQIYNNYIESSDFEKPIKNNLNLIINNVLNSSAINQEIENKKKEILKQFEIEKEKILNNESIPEEYKKEMLDNLEKQKEEALKELDKQIKAQLNKEDLSKQVVEQIRELAKSFLQKQDYVKIFTIFMYFSVISFLNNLVSFISSFLILIIDLIVSLISRIKKEKEEI